MSRFRTINEASKTDPNRLLLVKGPKGHNLCRFCRVEVEPPRRTFCSGARTRYSRRKINGTWTKVVYQAGHGCVHEWCLRNSPQYAREAVFDRDQGKCAHCEIQHPRKGTWQADHIIPVVEGGGECGLEGFQTLCLECHKKKTKKEKNRRSAVKKWKEESPPLITQSKDTSLDTIQTSVILKHKTKY